MPQSSGAPRVGVAFLLTQLGTFAAERFAASLTDLDLTPPLVGILRLVGSEPDLSQLELARRIGAVPSRVVALVDDLEQRGWVRRTRHPQDRRINLLSLTDAGAEALAAVAKVARAHEARTTAGFSAAERGELLALLTRLADNFGLEPGIHPGYKHLR